jgi:hypothetical protein
VLDYVGILVGVLGLLATIVGLRFVVQSLDQSAAQQRIEAGPYVRVDIGSLDLPMPDFSPPAYHFRSEDQVLNLESTASSGIILSAWFRNLQSHPLGTAYGVRAAFVVEGDEFEPAVTEVTIPYLESGKPVLIDIVRCAISQQPSVLLSELLFYDFYDRQHHHQFGSSGTNALHGRLSARAQDGKIMSVPEGRSRGFGVEFGSEEE